MQSRFAKLFGLTPACAGNGDRELMTITEWQPSVDIIEDEKVSSNNWPMIKLNGVAQDSPTLKFLESSKYEEAGVKRNTVWRFAPAWLDLTFRTGSLHKQPDDSILLEGDEPGWLNSSLLFFP